MSAVALELGRGIRIDPRGRGLDLQRRGPDVAESWSRMGKRKLPSKGQRQAIGWAVLVATVAGFAIAGRGSGPSNPGGGPTPTVSSSGVDHTPSPKVSRASKNERLIALLCPQGTATAEGATSITNGGTKDGFQSGFTMRRVRVKSDGGAVWDTSHPDIGPFTERLSGRANREISNTGDEIVIDIKQGTYTCSFRSDKK